MAGEMIDKVHVNIVHHTCTLSVYARVHVAMKSVSHMEVKFA